MLLRQRRVVDVTTTIILLIWIHTNSIADARRPKSKHICPIGFNLAYTKDKLNPICYQIKDPENFEDKFKKCSGNLYTSELYRSLDFNKTDEKFWAEYRSLYPGGPFIDWSYTDSTGDILTKTFDVKYDRRLGINDYLCTVIDIHGNLTATRCHEKHYRYCFVKPYNTEDLSSEGCEELEGYFRFWSPYPTCLAPVTGVSGSNVRATRMQAKDLCEKRKGSLLHRGWRYGNHPSLHVSEIGDWIEPLGMQMTLDEKLLWTDFEDGSNEVPESEWNFRDESFSPLTPFVALVNEDWYLVNSSYIFYDVICERSIHLRNVSLQISYQENDKLIVSVNDSSVDDSKIWCFSDAIYYPFRVKVNRIEDTNNFDLKPSSDGYYWCIHSDSKNFQISESNKELYIEDTAAVSNLYAIKIRMKGRYNFENLKKLLEVWSKKISEYIFLWTKYLRSDQNATTLDYDKIEQVLKQSKKHITNWEGKDEVLKNLHLKRIHLDARTALLHANVNPEMVIVSPGKWEDLEVLFMKSAYYCQGFDAVPTLPMGNSTTIQCKTYTCVGNFNEGVQWVETAVDNCYPPSQLQTTLQGAFEVAMEVTPLIPTLDPVVKGRSSNRDSASQSDESTETTITKSTPIVTPVDIEDMPNVPSTTTSTTITTTSFPVVSVVPNLTTLHPTPPISTPKPISTILPSTTAPPPNAEEQLQSIITNLEDILNDHTFPIVVEQIDEAFNDVDNLLEQDLEVDIPSTFLNLIDELGARAFLNGSSSASTIKRNIAILMADAAPEAPVRGLQISVNDNDTFTENGFKLLTDEINSTHLNADANDVVVQLPESVSNSERRVSFVVFRNDRAFPPAAGFESYSVNSRVLSVKVENVTHFGGGEAIELHFRPTVGEIPRNNSRTCAYWQFLQDGSGMWSQDGCTFIPASASNTLDTCRCTHLTHFAEVLVPKTVFSEKNETALEILSLIGCFVSIVGLILIGITAALFRTWRRDFSNKIWLQLCIAIFILNICFLIVVFVDSQYYNVGCLIVGIILHYSTLSSFCWMLVAAILSYRRLVLVFTRDASHKLLRAAAFAWGTPLAIVGLLLSISPQAYNGRFEEMTPNGSFCYPSGLALWLSVYAPIAILLLANWTLFILIVRSVFASRRIQRHGDSNEAMRCASVSCLLVFLFGLPWIFGLFSFNVVMAYLFVLTANYQGFVLFVFFIVGNKKTRDLWLNKLKIKQTRKIPVTSSTYTNNSNNKSVHGVQGWKNSVAGSGRVTTIEASMMKPKSLISSDDTRFS